MELKELRKEIIKYIIFTVFLIFGCIHITEIIHFIGYMMRILMPFILGCAIAFILNVLMNIVEYKLFKKWDIVKHKKWGKAKRPVSILITLVIVIGVVTFLCFLVIPELKNTTKIFVKNIPNYQEQATKQLDKIGIKEREIKQFTSTLDKTKKSAEKLVKTNSNQIFEFTIGFATNIISMITNFVLGIVFAVYLLSQKETLSRQVNKLLYAMLPKKRVEKMKEILSLSNKTFSNFVTGQVLEAVIIGLLCFVGMCILQIPYAPTISVLVGFTALIPVFGAFIGTFVGAFLIFMVNPMKALFFILFILVLQQVEGNFIYPKVVGKSVGLPSIWVMVAVTIGASTFGIIGMLLSVPICSILYSVSATTVNDKIKKKKIRI